MEMHHTREFVGNTYLLTAFFVFNGFYIVFPRALLAFLRTWKCTFVMGYLCGDHHYLWGPYLYLDHLCFDTDSVDRR